MLPITNTVVFKVAAASCKTLFWHFAWRTEENNQNHQSGQSVSELRFKSGNSKYKEQPPTHMQHAIHGETATYLVRKRCFISK
jgi:hypothetical protein